MIIVYIYIYMCSIYANLAAETCSCQIYEKLVNIQLQNIPTQHLLMFNFQQNPLKHEGETSSPDMITKGYFRSQIRPANMHHHSILCKQKLITQAECVS